MNVMNPAGFQSRFLARIIDVIIIFLVTGILSTIIYGEFYNNESYYITDYLGLTYGIFVPVVWYGYTLGRRMAENRIVRMDRKKVGIGTMLLRELVTGLIYMLTLGIGLIVSAFMVGLREDKRAIHDFIANTYVTTDRPSKVK